MLAEAMTESTVRLDVEAADWRAAVRSVGQLLVDNQAIQSTYVDAMVRYIEAKGPYVVIAPGVAVPHASPDDGASAVGLAVVRLKEPVAFGHAENDPVDLLFCLTSPDFASHISLLVGMTAVLGDAEALQRIRGADAAAAVIQTFAAAM